MVVKIIKETWGKRGIKTLIHHNEEEKINELWYKMTKIVIQLGHSNIVDAALRRIKKYWGEKRKYITEEEKQKYKAFFKDEECVFIIEKLARNIIEHRKLPEAIASSK